MNSIDSLIHILTLHCDGASELASRELDEPLSLTDRLALHGHLISCRACREFRHQIRKLHEVISGGEQARSESFPVEGTLSHEAHARISQAMSQANTRRQDDDTHGLD